VETAQGMKERIREVDSVMIQLQEAMLGIDHFMTMWEEEVSQAVKSLQEFIVKAREVSSLGAQQSQACSQVVVKSEEIRNLSFLVKRTMSELSQGSTMIKKATEDIGRVAREFEQVSISRLEAINRIVRGMGEFHVKAEANRIRFRELGKVITFLEVQTDKLKSEVQKFSW
jgi:hypothetical protein